MKILNRRGEPARTATPKAFANDWIAVDFTDGQSPAHGIVRPDRVQIESKPEWDFFASRNRSVVGHFWQVWSLNQEGRFFAPNRRRRQAGRRR